MRPNLQLYSSLIKLEFIKHLVHRASYFTGVFNYTIQVGAYFFLWQAVYGSATSLGGIAKGDMLSYVIIAWITRAFYFNNVDREISKEIREGKVALELIRPYSYAGVKVARAFGEALFRLIFFTIPSALLVYWWYPFKLPVDFGAAVLFGIATLGSFLLNVLLGIITGYLSFFTHSTTGLIRAKRVTLDLLSGLLIPITFYPEWAQNVIKYLPFQSISYLPNMIYLGKLRGWQAVEVIGMQVVWLLLLVALATLIWRRSLKALVVQGG